jgi:hypothetical protein
VSLENLKLSKLALDVCVVQRRTPYAVIATKTINIKPIAAIFPQDRQAFGTLGLDSAPTSAT